MSLLRGGAQYRISHLVEPVASRLDVPFAVFEIVAKRFGGSPGELGTQHKPAGFAAVRQIRAARPLNKASCFVHRQGQELPSE
jgi:hypothetical protein